jgi:Domain of unknown function (DUF4419)
MMFRLPASLLRKRKIANAKLAESVHRLEKDGKSMSIGVEVNPKIGRPGITFAVDSVTQAAVPVWSETLADSLGRRFQREILVLPHEGSQVINASVDFFAARTQAKPMDQNTRAMMISRLGSRCHPFIDAIHIAFSQHRPLAISPDAIWLLIAQGFSHHVSENTESLRARLVRHQGKRELQVAAADLTLDGFEKAITDFSSLIKQEINPVLHETLICNFSTTSPAIRTASEVALMDSFSSYFTYAMKCVCGIPKITIEGTPADWQSIRARVEVLATYELEWWVSRLRPILDEFVLAAQGHPTQSFWQAIYKPKDAYGDQVATGWITDLFPYLGDAPARRKNHVFNHERHNWALTVENGVETSGRVFDPLTAMGARLASFPSGLSSAPIKVSLQDGSSRSLDLVAGFLAVSQNLSDLALSPLVSWCVAELPPEKQVMIA